MQQEHLHALEKKVCHNKDKTCWIKNCHKTENNLLHGHASLQSVAVIVRILDENLSFYARSGDFYSPFGVQTDICLILL